MSDEHGKEYEEYPIESQIYDSIHKSPKSLTVSLPFEEYYPEITDEDVDNGFIIRYFTRQSNHHTGEIYELDKRTYNKVSSNPLYNVIALDWKITGKLDDIMGTQIGNSPVRTYTGVNTANQKAVNEADRELPGMKYKLMNFSQFWVNTGIA